MFCLFLFLIFFFGENISNEHIHPIIPGGKFQHRTVGFLDDRRPMPSRCGKYHIYNFGDRTGALEMWVWFFFFFLKRCSGIILPVQQNQFLLNDSEDNAVGLSTFKAAERELCTIGV